MQQADLKTAADLTQLVHLEPSFVRAASLMDIECLDELPRLKVTPNIVRALTQITEAIRDSRDRAWAVVGPFGAGKSTFALLLAALFAGKRKSRWIATALQDLKIADPALGDQVEVTIRSKPYVPILLQGGPQDFASSLLEGLAEAGRSAGTPLVTPRGYRDLARETSSGVAGPKKLARAVENAARNVYKAGYAGLVIVADEFGRFLDQVHNELARQNLTFVQELAELSGRARRGELHLFVVLHQNFEDYAVGLGAEERTEWSKIQGRFRQIALSEDPDNLYELLARCINIDSSATGMAQRAMSAAWELVRDFVPFSRAVKHWKSRLPRLFPLHPLSVYCLPRLSSKLGQNERTIFSFLLSDEPHSLRAFIREPRDQRHLPLLGLDWLCDYFLLNHASSLVPLRLRRRLAELNFALEQVGDGDQLATSIVKVVGILDLLESTELRPTEGLLAAALNVRAEPEWDRFKSALKALVSQRVLVARRYAGEFHVLPGSDFDVTEAISEAADRWRTSELDLAGFLNEFLDLSPLIARRHSFETGTVRVAGRRFVSTSEFQETASTTEGWRALNERPDLTIDYIVCSSPEELRLSERWVRRRHAADRILVLPKKPIRIRQLAIQIKAAQELAGRQEVRDDPVAKQELDLHLRYVGTLLNQRLAPVLHPASGLARWFWRGREIPLATDRDLQSLISNICDHLFHKSPTIVNELINRRQLSSASVVAVKKILSGLLESQGMPTLGFKGNGPEVTIFHAVFERTGWHRPDGADHGLRPPYRVYRFKPVWAAIHRFLDSTLSERRRLSDLWDNLARPPYGLRAGLAPLLIWSALIERRGECCVYERGTYLTTWSAELYDRFLRTPEEFEVRCVSRSALDDVLVSLANALPEAAGRSDRALGINDFLQRLFTWYRSLPDYAKRTGAISPKAKEFRRLLSTATDPIELVLTQLPGCLGLGSLLEARAAKTREAYCRKFQAAVDEVSHVYARLLDQLIQKLSALLGNAGDGRAVQAELVRLKEFLADEFSDPTDKAFLLRASESMERPDTWAESVGAVVLGLPPRFWTDQSVEEFEERVAIIVERLRLAEKARVIRARAGLTPKVEPKWITLAGADGTLIDEVVSRRNLSGPARRSLCAAEEALRNVVIGLDPTERRDVLVELIQRLWRKRAS